MPEYINSRPAKVGEKLRTHSFHPGMIEFAAPENLSMAVRILPGTELAFATAIKCSQSGFGLFGWKVLVVNHTTATFRQINQAGSPHIHHDALEFPDGQIVLLNHLLEGQQAKVLQLPVQVVRGADRKGQKWS